MRLAQTTTAMKKYEGETLGSNKHRTRRFHNVSLKVFFGLGDSYFIENVCFCIHKEVSAACLCVCSSILNEWDAACMSGIRD